MTRDRDTALHRFAAAALRSDDIELAPASADASFRSYWRVRTLGDRQSHIVMDAPPDKENTAPWLDVGARLRAAGLHAPRVFAVDAAQGFILMEDLGDRPYLPELEATRAEELRSEELYGAALDALALMQAQVSADRLPVFDDVFVKAELELMPTWFLERHLGRAPSCGEWDTIEAAFGAIAGAVAEQPRTFMHRDYHSRNLMILAGRREPGIIDFQGAMLGPIAYDAASLLRDCYIAWPVERVDAWAEAHRQRLVKHGLAAADARRFRRWFDLAGLQRHVKVLGIFCRLYYRDGKPGYLADLPRVLGYVLDVAARYPELADFRALLHRAVADSDIALPRQPAVVAAS